MLHGAAARRGSDSAARRCRARAPSLEAAADARGVGLAPLALLVPLGAFAIWAAADFSGAFTFFHHLLFTNDLWLLDPQTDLLIRICPSSMFATDGIDASAVQALARIAPVSAC